MIDRVKYAREMNARYDALDTLLIAKGFPPTSPWWRAQVRRYFEHPGVQVVFRVGRRGGKSSTLCRIAVLEALFGAHKVPPGELGIVAIVSVERRDATDRFKTIEAILDALRVKYHAAGDTIELAHRPFGFRVFTASIAGVSGFTSICMICDEVSKWSDRSSGTNPAQQVIESARPTMATQPLAKMILSSSPFGSLDAHAKEFDKGDSEFQFVAAAATWEANPTITEARTHLLEPDEIAWKREYAAIPQASSIAALDPSLFATLVRPVRPYSRSMGAGVLVFDSSAGRGDAWTWCAVEYVLEPSAQGEYMTAPVYDANGDVAVQDAILYDPTTGKPIPNPNWKGPKPALVTHSIRALEGQFAREVTFANAVEQMCASATANGMVNICGDQFNAYAIQSEAERHGCNHEQRNWTSQNKANAAATLRRLIREGTFVIEPGVEGEKMKKELEELEERVLPSGVVQIASRRAAAGHGDRASLALMTALLESEGAISGSPIRSTGGFKQWDPYTGAS